MAENTKKEEQLPKLSQKEFSTYNRMAEGMEYYHNNFRQSWNMLYKACETGKRPPYMSLGSFINAGLDFCHHLTAHHGIEEKHIFPQLAARMPAFQKELELLTQHKQIHAGLEKLEDYLEASRDGREDFRLHSLKLILDGFGKVLWEHLEQEVKELGAENMRKYWTLEEMKRLPF